jgi:ABC-type transport system involved in multi-copper enzyme maturation permease subunit
MLQKTKGSTWRLMAAGLAFLVPTLVGTATILLAGNVLPDWAAWPGWGVLGLGLVLLLAAVGRRAFGPVLFYDLVRSTRRGRYAALRCVYAVALFVLLFLFYSRWTNTILDVLSVESIDRSRAAQFAEEFFHGFMTLQFLAVFALTPAFTAGAIAEEKDRRTLEFLFTTDLHSHEIVLGKLVSRLAFLTLLLLTGLPVLSLLQFLGGVDPNLVAGGFAAVLLTMLSLASLSLLNSAYARKPLTAMFLTYLQMAVYLVASGIAVQFVHRNPARWGAGDHALLAFGAGNLRVAVQQLDAASFSVGGVSAALPRILGGYALFHGVVAVVSLLGATLPLRRWVRAQASRGNRRAFVLALSQRRLPRVGSRPMIWKELFAEPTFRFNRAGMVITATFVTLCLFFGLFIEACSFAFGLWGDMDVHMNAVTRGLGTFIACLLLLGVAVRAAGSFSGERDRQTLVSLLCTPLRAREILGAKWLGSVLVGRLIWVYLLAIWLAALFTGGLHPAALPLLVAAWFCYAAFLASLGLYFSVVSRTSLRATVWTLVTVLGTCIGPWLLSAFWALVQEFLHPQPYRWRYAAGYGQRANDWTDRIPDLLSAVAPPSTLNFLTFYGRDLDYPPGSLSFQILPHHTDPLVRLVAIAIVLFVYFLAALLLYQRACAAFPTVTGRMSSGRAAPPRLDRRGA